MDLETAIEQKAINSPEEFFESLIRWAKNTNGLGHPAEYSDRQGGKGLFAAMQLALTSALPDGVLDKLISLKCFAIRDMRHKASQPELFSRH